MLKPAALQHLGQICHCGRVKNGIGLHWGQRSRVATRGVKFSITRNGLTEKCDVKRVGYGFLRINTKLRVKRFDVFYGF